MKTNEVKRKEAAARNEQWARLTPQQQLDVLDMDKLVATKQRAKIMKRMEK